MKRTAVMVGCGVALLPALDQALPAASLIVVDDPDVIAARGLRDALRARGCVAALREAPIQDEEAARAAMAGLDLPDDVSVVFPGQEYGVVAAAELAHRLGLPGAGPAAARILRDKILLRDAAQQAGLAQPAWTEVTSEADVRAFGRPSYVLKPANLQASVGVQLLTADDDVAAAWQRTIGADEPAMRAPRRFRPRYLVESRLDGPEMSVEALVHEGEVVFANLTAKSVAGGRHPIELGHVLPAAVAPGLADRLLDDLRTFVKAIGFGSGTLHSEWILVGGVPHLVECAGRLPGDELIPLLDLAYGGNIVADLVTVLSGQVPSRPAGAARAACVRFLTAEPGVVVGVHGVDEAAAMPGVVGVRITRAPGDRIDPLVSSWDRAGRVIATGPTADAAEAAAEAAARAVTVATAPAGVRDVTDPASAVGWWPARARDPRESSAWAAGTSEPVSFLGLDGGPALWLRASLCPPTRMNIVDVVGGLVGEAGGDEDLVARARQAHPRQLVCAATGYGSPVVAATTPHPDRLSTLVATFVEYARQRGATPAVLHCPAGDPLLDALAANDFAVGVTDLYPVLDLPGDSMRDYLAALPKGRRGNVRREIAALAGGRAEVHVGERARPHLAAAASLNVAGYRQRGSDRNEAEARAVYERLLDHFGDRLLLTTVSAGGRPVASAVLLIGDGDLLLYSAGLLLPDSRAVAGYFNAAYYLPIEYAYANGLRRIMLGPTGRQAKRLRGARFEPLYSAVPRHDRTLTELLAATDARLRAAQEPLAGPVVAVA
ncbi:GNAT family N-acetyltransferase [Micromonospora sp. NPDC050980]|uniref:GNAT family N-acetyltransferase n=1 Tax=Micromonospora sp. NPDC050980 TaxID=3155161 RepID=UPI0033E251F7